MKKISIFSFLLVVLLLFMTGCGETARSAEKETDKTALSSLLTELVKVPRNKEQTALIAACTSVLDNSDATQKEIDEATTRLKTLKTEIFLSPVTFTDPALEAYVRTTLSRTDANAVTVGECFTLEVLDCRGDDAASPVRMTYDLRYFPNLKTLLLEGNAVTELTGLFYLKNLTELSLTPAAGKELSYVTIGALPLTSLTITGADLSSFSELPSIHTLTSLTLIDCTCPDLNGIALKYPGLKSLKLNSCAVQGLSALKNCTLLQSLDLSGTKTGDASFLSEIKSLSSLCLSGCTDITANALSQLTQLSSLDVSYCGLSDLSWLSALDHLSVLNLCGNQISDLTGTVEQTALTDLDLSKNLLTEFFLTDPFRNLTALNLSENELEQFSIHTSDRSCALKTLNLSGNRLTGVDVNNAVNLLSLDLSDNQIIDCDLRLESLTTLNLLENPLIGFYFDLPSLNALFFSSEGRISSSGVSLYAPKLRTVDAGKARWDSLSFLTYCDELNSAVLNLSDAEDMSAIFSLETLEDLTLLNADETTIAKLTALERLKKLTLINGTFAAASISGLENLESLCFENCTELADLSNVKNLPALRQLSVISARCAEPVVQNFPLLESLSLDACGVRSLAGVQNLPRLSRISLTGNGLTGISIINFPSLSFIDLRNNEISSYEACVFDMALGTLDLRNNPISTGTYASSPAVEVLTDHE